ncbi:hypothetical protein VSDG_00179 [Cytospora chrysosperma]|uniref:Uncharacterized protein n=1 Tax=Cytospora chrysosperma TaxID=252740 RepID=A0A423WP55_CYTCH|nr:hypothetical protein VSDG_00179 [Valsa sordida]
MTRARKLLPPDPRPSRAHPEHRATRKQLEKEHGYGWVPPVILGLVGLTLAFDVAKDVEKAEEKHKKRDQGQGRQQGEGEEEEQERKRKRRGEARGRSSRRRHRGDHEDDDGGVDGYEYINGDEYDTWHGGKRDGLLARGDRLEKGEGGPWDRGREGERERRKRSEYNDVGVDDYYAEDEGRYPRRGRDDLDYERGRRALDDRRSRPRPRRRSSDW